MLTNVEIRLSFELNKHLSVKIYLPLFEAGRNAFGLSMTNKFKLLKSNKLKSIKALVNKTSLWMRFTFSI